MKKFALLLIVLSIVLYSDLSAQLLSGQKDNVIVKGKVVDIRDGKPVGAEITLVDGKKKVKFESDPATGSFERILKIGETYPITINGSDVLRTESELRIDKKDKNNEARFVIKATRLYVGLPVADYLLFDKNSSGLNSKSQTIFDEIQTSLRFNRTINVKFLIGSADSYSSENAQAKKLRQDRIHTLENLFESDRSWRRYKTRITIEEDSGFDDPSKNLSIVVSSFEDIFK